MNRTHNVRAHPLALTLPSAPVGCSALSGSQLSSPFLGFVELDPTCQMLQQLRWQLIASDDPGSYCTRKPGLTVIGRVPLPDVPRATLVKLVNSVVHLNHTEFTVLPSVELTPQVEERLAQFPIVRDARILTNQAFDSLRSVFHMYSSDCPTVAFTLAGS
jgi:hypothetical protein